MIVHRKKWKQTLAGAIVSLGAACQGVAVLLPPSAQSPFKGPRTYFAVSERDRSIIACILMISVATGNLVSGVAADAYGPKKSLVATSVPLISGYILVLTANNYLLVIIGRALVGFASGASVVLASVYICESCEASVRGSISTLVMLFMSLGNFLTYILDDLILNWNITSSIALSVPVILFLSVLLVPETPRYLIANQREEEAEEALVWLREDGVNISEELAHLKANLTSQGTSHSLLDIFSDGFSAKLYACAICLGLIFAFCGGQVFLSFAELLLLDLRSSITSEHLPILLGFAQFVGASLSFSLVNLLGRRFLLITSGTGIFTCWATICICTFLYPPEQEYSPIPSHFLPVVLMLGLFFYSFGYLPLYIPVATEILPPSIRAMGTASTAMTSALTVSVLLTTYLPMSAALGVHGTFMCYASFGLASLLFILLFIPETNKKSLEEINALLKKTGMHSGLS